jgi:peroxiredoxin
MRGVAAIVAAALLAAARSGLSAPLTVAREPAARLAGPAAEGCDASAKRAKLDFKLKDLRGSSVKLADFTGKVVVLNFWATWCAPCKTEIPDFVELQARHGEAGLQMLGIAADGTVKQLEPFVESLKINYPVLQGRGQNALLDAYAVSTLPVTVLIRRDGTICRRYAASVHKDVLESQIKPLL